MNISNLNVRITIQKNAVVIDKIGNHTKRVAGLLLLLRNGQRRDGNGAGYCRRDGRER